MKREEPSTESRGASSRGHVVCRARYPASPRALSSLDWDTRVGASPVRACGALVRALGESGCLGVQLEAGGKPHPRLNITVRPIANKYREGKLQRTLKREFKRT